MFELTTERPEDTASVETLLDRAFGPNRKSKTSYRYRQGVEPVSDLRLVARAEHDEILGSIRYWPILIGARPALLLGPLAVAPERKGQGIGAALVFRSLEMALWARHRLVLLVGDIDYYRRFGFASAPPHGIVVPGEMPHRVLVRELARGALAEARGTVRPAPSMAKRHSLSGPAPIHSAACAD